MRLYHYVGPEAVLARTLCSNGAIITSIDDPLEWLARARMRLGPSGLVTVTFVIDADGRLRIADRRSEHVACADGQPVLSAGEMTLALPRNTPVVVEVSNQSAGYCPEVESWPAVADALDPIPIPHPERFTLEVEFRRCPLCGQVNIVKDDWFHCGVCDSPLPEGWNFADSAEFD